ncbi:Ubiquitin-conjugating enzyme E2 Z [Colletotrichum sp. SAR11_59]|uniref:Ubiquitin-conjugating enzyme E2 Z n=1 Tax=Colletotrichum asianum TaxID=702518 RepID=A0A8H3ZXV8_9PEZI|nr:ubiquitin-conjugating enzyme [Colletotrichum asianum]KAI8315910.1 Ubiquitin-conjugating enzyme E2 Z [Colletotrichum sp. SAR11_59]
MADQSIIRITKELSDIQRTSDLSLAVACRDVDVRNVKALIIGPHDTPYEFGFFEFAIRFNKDYPRKSPNVNGITTNGGRCRFNPNIYASGKVCLSILGTWRGERGEEWSAAQGLESILISIQSLMSSNPYENEPGFEEANEASDKKHQKDYVHKIRHETLRISIIQRLEEYLGLTPEGVSIAQQSAAEQDIDMDTEDMDDTSVPFEPFKDLCKRRFLWYYDNYLSAVQKAKTEVKDHQAFARMPFEGASNSMDGKFNYTELERRLRNIKAALDNELVKWAKEGQIASDKEMTVSVNLRHQYEQVVQAFKRQDIPHDVQLEDNNPFVWVITYFGRPMTNLDGGLFRIKIHFSPRFPEEQPRVKFNTRIFHHRIAEDGTACYFPNNLRKDDVRSHIEAVFAALEEEDPAYDPRTLVNPEAHKLYWGGADERKNYNRRLRRSVQQSME